MTIITSLGAEALRAFQHADNHPRNQDGWVYLVEARTRQVLIDSSDEHPIGV
jgi:hypothetical protein